VRDITRRRQAEMEREQLIAELDAFAHTAAHDLKSPLSTIVGFTQLLNEELNMNPVGEAGVYVHHIERLSHKMITIINELLLLANVRTSESVNVQVLDMDAIIASVKDRLRFVFEDHNATLITPEKWPRAVGYAPWIEEVWTNYISNAIKYGGTPPRIEIGGTPLNNGMVMFWSRDNGGGIPPEKQAQLFQPFVRLGELRIQGHGLGLSIVRRIVERLGGKVGIESVEGRGSTFSFTLPSR
jgi:signal transduction histidine kinase